MFERAPLSTEKSPGDFSAESGTLSNTNLQTIKTRMDLMGTVENDEQKHGLRSLFNIGNTCNFLNVREQNRFKFWCVLLTAIDRFAGARGSYRYIVVYKGI